ncbi:hypothetical protein NEOC65_002482 [Neochlamydia sp. AcF65]|nr:hypothetical protein [Neochlamydia sp. AcF65]MBS4169634.1 hypothetical protein [Neochlamydia sp. AcF95]
MSKNAIGTLKSLATASEEDSIAYAVTRKFTAMRF